MLRFGILGKLIFSQILVGSSILLLWLGKSHWLFWTLSVLAFEEKNGF